MPIKPAPKALVAECDGCGARQVIEDPAQDDIIGIDGTVHEISGTGGSGSAKWFACRSACIKKAVETALNRAWGHEQ